MTTLVSRPLPGAVRRRGGASLAGGALLALAVAAAAAAPALAQTPTPGSPAVMNVNSAGARGGALSTAAPAAGDFVPGELIVRFKEQAGPSDRALARRSENARLKERLPGVDNLELLALEKGTSPRAAARSFERRSDVLYAEPNPLRQIQALPNDSRLGELWGFDNTGQAVNNGVAGTADADMDVFEAWNATTGSASVPIAVIDSGVAYDHPDLAPNLWTNPGEACPTLCNDGVDNDGNGYIDDVRGYDFFNNDNDPRDDNGHGTHVAGTIGARGDNDTAGAGTTDVAGVNRETKLMALKVCNAQGQCSGAAQIKAEAYAARMGARVANMSLGGSGSSQAESDAFKAAAAKTLFVVAAGNGGDDHVGDDNDAKPQYPCSYPAANIVCVAATDQNDQFASFSNFGARSVDVAAPGVNILSTYPGLSTVASDDFETDPFASARWTRGGTPNTWGSSTEWASAPGGRSIHDSPGAGVPYAPSTDSWIGRAPFNLTGLAGCTLSYLFNLDVAPGDGFYTELATSAGGPWTPILAYNGQGAYTVTHPLNGYAGQSAVYVRYRLISDASTQANGAWVDDLALKCLGNTYSSDSYQYLQGTSMATPNVAGVAGLMFAQNSKLTVAVAKARLLASVDKKASLNGTNDPSKKIATGGRVNAYKAVALTTAGVSNGVLTITSGAGAVNRLAITKYIGTDNVERYRVSDPYGATGSTGSRVLALPGCLADGLRARCNAAGITSVKVLGGFGDDTVSASTLAIPVLLDGGEGNDALTGGAAADTLIGGTGADRFTSGAGDDTIDARNDDVDSLFLCGENTGDSDTVKADATPNDPVVTKTTNCEVVEKF